CQQHNSYHSF
nr:immunoglobulin light chain junction region [Macaca mulatta]MOV34882.1 immunoglobulin light chain junction region [Macaca mulatta]MOV35321.1 immunoglobulin light chain junction region [Macaca mulatta]MOV35535.1 immunoglobulin light chain junction region [Macaca mulatta]